MHKLQKILLKRLLVENNQRYSSLTQGYNYDDNIVFHLKRLLKEGLVGKSDSVYSITTKGIKKITEFDTSLDENIRVKTFFIGFLCNFEREYLIKKHPHGNRNFYNLPSGKPMFGEKIEEALVRTFENNTDVKLIPKSFEFISLHLKTIKTSEGEVLFDDAFAIYKVNITRSQKESMRLDKQIEWISEEKIKKLSNCWPEIDICILAKNFSPYLAYDFTSNYILDT